MLWQTVRVSYTVTRPHNTPTPADLTPKIQPEVFLQRKYPNKTFTMMHHTGDNDGEYLDVIFAPRDQLVSLSWDSGACLVSQCGDSGLVTGQVARMNPSIFSHYTVFSPTLSSGSIFSNFIYSAGSWLSKSHCDVAVSSHYTSNDRTSYPAFYNWPTFVLRVTGDTLDHISPSIGMIIS